MATFPRKAPTPPSDAGNPSWLQPADMIFQPPGPPGGYFQYNQAPLFAPSPSSSSSCPAPSPSLPMPHRAHNGIGVGVGVHQPQPAAAPQNRFPAPASGPGPSPNVAQSACGSGVVGASYGPGRSCFGQLAGPPDFEGTKHASPVNLGGCPTSSPTYKELSGATPSTSSAAPTPTPLGSGGVRTDRGFGQSFVDSVGGDQSSPTYSPGKDRLDRSQEAVVSSPAARGPFPKARQPPPTAAAAKQDVPDVEMEYLKRNVDHLKSQKRRLEDRVQSLEARVQGLEEQKEQYRMLYEQSQHQAMTTGGEREIHCLREQLYAVTYLKDALNRENEDLLKRLETAHGEESKQGACVICMDNLANLVCFPCKHLALCAFCDQRENIVYCPICRGPAERKEQIYMP